MNEPLTKWYCDVCGEKIEDAKSGYVIWKNNAQRKSHAFKIIHQKRCDRKDHSLSAALTDFLGERGLAYLLAQVSIGPIKKNIGQVSECDVADTDEFVDFMRRLQTPFYEEARRHFTNPELLEDYSDANEVLPYRPEELKKIVDRFG